MTVASTNNEPGTYTQAVKALLLNRILLVLSFVGLFVAGALSLEKYLNIVLPCGEAHGCATVALHPSSMMFGVLPVAYIGLAGYILFAGLAIIRTITVPNGELLVKIGFYASIVGALYSVYLQYLSFFHIHAICPYCLTSAITMILTVIVYAMLNKTIGKEVVNSGDVSTLDMWLVGGLPVALIIGLTIMSGDKKTPVLGDASIKNPTYADLIPTNAKQYGPDLAPITIVEFADLCCPACQDKSPKVKQWVITHPGKARIIFRDFPLNMHPLGRVAAAIGEYAHEKGKFWDYAMSVMGLNRQPESAAEILGIAKSLGMDPDDIRKRLKNKVDPVYDRITGDLNLGHKVGVNSTPTFFILTKTAGNDQCGPKEIIDILNSDRYKKILAGNG